MKRMLAAALVALAGCASGPRLHTPKVVEKSGPPLEIGEQGDFSEAALRNGVRATQEQCDRLPNAVWAVTPHGDSACLKYWAVGLGASKRVVVYFSGDAWEGAGRTAAAYLATTDAGLAQAAQRTGDALGVPYVFLARPGMFGASGDHMQRRRPAESQLVSAALDALKMRHGIEEFVVAGFSGGGHVTASLLAQRRDIVCAVPGGSPSSPRLRARLRQWAVDATGYADSYEPTQHLRKESVHPQLRIFVAGDPRDANGVWPAQVVLAEAARAQGIAAEVVELRGTGPSFHGGQADAVRSIAAACAKDLPTAEILRQAAARP